MVHGKSYQSDNKVQHQEIFLYTDKIWFILFILSFERYINLQDEILFRKLHLCTAADSTFFPLIYNVH